jgi:DNA-binding transcriptional ArsR family regulator
MHVAAPDALFKSLADPTRRSIFERLARMEQSGFRPEEERNYQGANYGWQRVIGGLEQVVARLT